MGIPADEEEQEPLGPDNDVEDAVENTDMLDEANMDPIPDEPVDDEEEAPKTEEPPKEEEVKEAPKEEAPKQEPPKKKTKKKGKKKKSSNNSNDGNDEGLEMWKKISAKKGSEINWYLMKLKGKVGKSTDLTFVKEGSGGAAEIVEFLKEHEKSIMFGLLKCITTDDGKSVRGKFIYIRFIGSKVKTMSKAKLTPSLGKIDDNFPCKHLTVDITEKCADDLAPKNLAKELLRVGGAHKPDTMSFGPDQDVDVKSLK